MTPSHFPHGFHFSPLHQPTFPSLYFQAFQGHWQEAQGPPGPLHLRSGLGFQQSSPPYSTIYGVFFPESLPLTLHSKIPLQTHSLSADHFLPNLRKWGPTGMKPPELPSLHNPPHLPFCHFSPFWLSPVEPEPFIKLTYTLGLSPATCTGSINLLLVLKLLPHPWLPSTLPCWFSHSTYHIWHMTHFIYLIFNCLSLLRPLGVTLSTP